MFCTPLLPSQSVNGITSHDEEEINELQEDDRELFSDQLSSIGMMGRVAADHCIPLLTRLHARTRACIKPVFRFPPLTWLLLQPPGGPGHAAARSAPEDPAAADGLI